MISEFQGKYRFLSNFWPVDIEYDGIVYSTVEHAYHASKTTQLSWMMYIASAPTPGSAKRRAKEIPIEFRRRNWKGIREEIMFELLMKKFSNGKLREQLLATGDEELVEGNTWGDTFWGVCRGKGENKLGKMIMKIRDGLKANGNK